MKFKNLYLCAILAASTSLAACSSEKAEQPTNEPEVKTEEPEVLQPSKPNTKWIPAEATILDSGLGIVITNPGDSTRANLDSPVTLNYKGTLARNGQVFDSSYKNGKPATFTPRRVVPGFAEGMRQIGKGGKATLYIPYQLAYGNSGAGGAVGPNENLIFEIEILDIQPERTQDEDDIDIHI